MRIWDRVVLACALALVAAVSVGCPERGAESARASVEHITLLAAYDFPREDARGRELSGIAWEESSRTLYAISDTVPAIVPLRPSADFRTWTFGDPIVVNVADAWDGEGIVVLPREFYVANERGPHIYELDRQGKEIAELKLPPLFANALKNKALESLSLSPDGRYLFTANESTIVGDGPQPTTSHGATVRILRHDRQTGDEVEHAYRTEPVFAEGPGSDMGVSDLLALSATDLLVMERSYVPAVGNSVRIFRATLAEECVIDQGACSLTTKVARKRLVLDFASMPGAEIAGHGGKLFPNYEGLALGPSLADGRRIIFVISDDNANPELVARVLVLATTGFAEPRSSPIGTSSSR